MTLQTSLVLNLFSGRSSWYGRNSDLIRLSSSWGSFSVGWGWKIVVKCSAKTFAFSLLLLAQLPWGFRIGGEDFFTCFSVSVVFHREQSEASVGVRSFKNVSMRSFLFLLSSSLSSRVAVLRSRLLSGVRSLCQFFRSFLFSLIFYFIIMGQSEGVALSILLGTAFQPASWMTSLNNLTATSMEFLREVRQLQQTWRYPNLHVCCLNKELFHFWEV